MIPEKSTISAIMYFSLILLVSLIGGADAFSPIPNRHLPSRGSLARMPSLLSSRPPLVMLRMNDDGGWYDDDENSISDSEFRNQELSSLQKARQSSREQQQLSSSNNQGPERDLFIPIFALVSILGFTSLYGYEMLRLASRGELYLPWQN
jgi:hypothetical protein